MVVDGEVSPKEYDYLLSMPLWSLCSERINELTIQMNKKKDEHDMLEGTHINELWDRDLDEFLIALTK
jgi:DNA topoisomerase-2